MADTFECITAFRALGKFTIEACLASYSGAVGTGHATGGGQYRWVNAYGGLFSTGLTGLAYTWVGDEDSTCQSVGALPIWTQKRLGLAAFDFLGEGRWAAFRIGASGRRKPATFSRAALIHTYDG